MSTNKSLQSVVVRDENGNPVGLVLDGAIYRLQTETKIQDRLGSGTAGALNDTVVASTAGCATVAFTITGTWSGLLTLEATVEGTNWFLASGVTTSLNALQLNYFSGNVTALVNCGGFSQVRLRMSSYTSGTATIAWNAGQSAGILTAGNPDGEVSAIFASLNAAGTIAVSGSAGAGFQLLAGTFIGTLVPEVSSDDGNTWSASFFVDPATGNKTSSLVYSSNNTAALRGIVLPGGASHTRVRVSAYTSGTANATVRSTTVASCSPISEGAAGSTAPPNTMQVGGVDSGGLLRSLVMVTNRADVNLGGVTGLEAASSGSITTLNGTIGPSIQGMSTCNFNVTGTWEATLTIEASLDGSNFFTVMGLRLSDKTIVSSITENDQLIVPCGGYSVVRLKATEFTSGSVSVVFRAGFGSNAVLPTNTDPLNMAVSLGDGAGAALTLSVAQDGRVCLPTDNPLIARKLDDILEVLMQIRDVLAQSNEDGEVN